MIKNKRQNRSPPIVRVLGGWIRTNPGRSYPNGLKIGVNVKKMKTNATQPWKSFYTRFFGMQAYDS